VIEMLLQSQNGELHLLPALPQAWRDGKATGLVGRGNYVVDLAWRDGRLKDARVTARLGGQCVIRSAGPFTVDGVKARSTPDAIGHTLSFKAVKGTSYLVRPAR
jgi:alpha-L-fucosidase 2